MYTIIASKSKYRIRNIEKLCSLLLNTTLWRLR